jgi:spore maturation protein SpmB
MALAPRQMWTLIPMLVAALVGVAALGLLDLAFVQIGLVLDVIGLRYVPGTVCDDPVSLGCLLSDGGAAAAGLAAAAAADTGNLERHPRAHRRHQRPTTRRPGRRATTR